MCAHAGNRALLIGSIALTSLLIGSAAMAESRGVIYKFGATWCGPCQKVAPLVAKLEREGLPVRSIDIDQQQELANKFRVDRVPTFVLVIDGKEADRVVGLMTETELRQMVARIPAGNPPAIAQPSSSPMPPPGPFEISLGQAGPIPRPTNQPVHEEPAAPVEQPRSGLTGLWPFGHQPEPETTVRGNDSTVSAPAAVANAAPTGTDPMAASIRIRVKIGDKMNLGSGTVISSRSGHTLIMTCGHIFRDFTTDGKIEVDVFDNGQPRLFLARLEKYNLEADVGLISIPTDQPLPQIPVARREAAPGDGQQVACIGCSGGENPSREQLRVTAIDRYEGPHNIECTGVPVRGRSGGGLFNQQGELIGICIAADTEGQRGLYAGLFAIHKLLDECSLTALYEPAPVQPVTPAAPASTPNLLANNGSPAFPEAREVQEPPAASNPFSPMTPAASEPANPVDVATGNAEVVVIIRDPNRPGAPNRVVIIHEASPAFMKYLDGELGPGELPTNSAFGQQAPPHREQLVPAMESRQSPQWPAVHEVQRQLRSSTSNYSAPVRTAKASLEPTSLARPMQPQRYVRAITP